MLNFIKKIIEEKNSNIHWESFLSARYPIDQRNLISILRKIQKHNKALSDNSVKNKGWYSINASNNSFWFDFKDKNRCTVTINYSISEGNWEIMDWERIRIGFNNELKEYFSLFLDDKVWILGNPFDLLILSHQNTPTHISTIEKYLYEQYLSPSDSNPGNILYPKR